MIMVTALATDVVGSSLLSNWSCPFRVFTPVTTMHALHPLLLPTKSIVETGPLLNEALFAISSKPALIPVFPLSPVMG